MPDLKELKRQAIESVERRAFEARFSMAAICKRADVTRQAWGNAKFRGSIGPEMLGKMERALDALIAEKVA